MNKSLDSFKSFKNYYICPLHQRSTNDNTKTNQYTMIQKSNYETPITELVEVKMDGVLLITSDKLGTVEVALYHNDEGWD